MKKYFLFILGMMSFMNAETLFEVKDSANNKVLDISTDGLRVMNLGDTLMVISASDIRANLTNSKGLSRSFSVSTTSSTKGSANDIMRLTGDSTRFWISDAGSGFGVATRNAGLKGTETNVLEVSTSDTKMREGDAGERYTEFSPENIFIGLNSGHPTTPGVGNVFVGNDAGKSAAASMFSTFIGSFAGSKTVGGIRNTFVGNCSGLNNYDGYSNTFYGDNSGYHNTSGFYNNYFGHEAGYNNTTGYSNSVFGFGAGYGTIDAVYYYNCIFGSAAGRLLTTGSSNIMVGYYSGYRLTSGSNNVYLGEKTGYNNQIGAGNVFLGYNAGYNETGSSKLYIDNSNTTTPLIYGDFAADSIKINGEFAVTGKSYINTLDVSGSSVLDGTLSVGSTLSVNSTVNVNSDEAIYSDGTNFRWGNGGSANYFPDKVGIGVTAPERKLHVVETANASVVYFQNTNPSYDAYISLQSGDSLNVNRWDIISEDTGCFALLDKNVNSYRYRIYPDGSIAMPQIYSKTIGATNRDLFIDSNGYIGYVSSSLRYKKNIKDMENVSWLFKLRPVNYNYKTDEVNKKEYGLIAEEVEKVNPSFVSYNKDGSVETVNYSSLITPMLKAIQDQQAMIDELRKEIEALKKK